MSIHVKQILPQESKGKGTLKRLTKYMALCLNALNLDQLFDQRQMGIGFDGSKSV